MSTRPLARGKSSSGLIFLWFALFYTLCTSGQVYTPDGAVMGRVAYSIVHGQGLAVDPQGIPDGFLFPGVDHRLYAKYGAGLSFASVPHAWLGRILPELVPSSSVDLFVGPKVLWYRPRDPSAAWHFFALSLVSALVSAATCAFLYAFLRQLKIPAKASLAATVTVGLASPLWPYAKDYFAEPLAGLGLILFAWAIESTARREVTDARSLSLSFGAGFGLGLTVLAKVAHFVLFPAAALVLIPFLRRPSPGRSRLQTGSTFLLGLTIPCLIIAWYNLVRFGNIMTTGYEWELNRWSTPIGQGLSGLLVSPGHGLLPYFPPLLLAIAYTRASYRRSPHWTLFSWAALILLVGFYCRWYAWSGGWCWGPRFLLPNLPFLAFLLVPFFESPPRSRLLRGLGWGSLAAGLMVAFTGTLVPSTEYHQQAMETIRTADWADRLWWNWSYFPGWAYLSFVPKSFYLITRALRLPVGWWLSFLFGLGLVCLVPLAGLVRRRVLEASRPIMGLRGRLLWLIGALALGAILAVISWTSGPRVVLQYDFEGPRYGDGWEEEGSAFGPGPARGGFEKQQILGGFGGGLVNTFQNGKDTDQGVLRSPEFTIHGDKATFMIGGGEAQMRIFARLLIDGQEAFRVTGNGRDLLARGQWDLRPYWGRKARLELVDAGSGEGDYLLFDDFRIYLTK